MTRKRNRSTLASFRDKVIVASRSVLVVKQQSGTHPGKSAARLVDVERRLLVRGRCLEEWFWLLLNLLGNPFSLLAIGSH